MEDKLKINGNHRIKYLLYEKWQKIHRNAQRNVLKRKEKKLNKK